MGTVINDEFEGQYQEDNTKSRTVHKGDFVIMNRKYPVPDDIIGRIFKVLDEPEYKKGRRICHLEGYGKGAYPADGLRVVG